MAKSLINVCVICAMIVPAIGCSNVPRDSAASLAVNVGRLNDQIEKMTASRRQIEVARERLTTSMELTTAKAVSRSVALLYVWETVAQKGDAYETRLKIYNAALKFVDAATQRDAAMLALNEKLAKASEQAKGERSKELTEAGKLLAGLSKERSLEDEMKFLASYAKSVHSAMEDAKKDAEAAAKATEKKADATEAVEKNAIVR